MKSLLLASFFTAFCSGALAKPITAVIRLKERTPVENLAYYARTQSTPLVRYYTATDIRKISAPATSDYLNLLATLNSKGFKVVSQSPTHLWMTLEGDSELFENTFNTRIEFLTNGTHRNDGHFTIPADLSLIGGMVGLDNTRKSHPHYKRADGPSLTMGGISPDTIKNYYGFNPIYSQGIYGSNQHVAIATYNGFKIEHVNYYYQALNLKPGPTVDQVEFNGTPTYDEGSAGETELDAEFVGMIAPGSNVHVFASKSNDDAGELQMFTAILDDNRAKVVNYSWGACERDVDSNHQTEMNKIFARAVAQGVNIMVASGDSGSNSCQDGTVAADWPAAHNNVVAVGGTSLYPHGNDGRESAWSGSGGGISGIYALPDWQNSLSSNFTKRTYPDVSFNADPYTGQAVWTGSWEVIGGTSMAAPQWSGFLALVNEARTRNNLGTLGFLNPIIYGLSDQDRAEAFTDITQGRNGAYQAGPGYDAVTGLGTMHADALLQKLMH
ncbi:MAG: S8 family serine peptidase [Bacillota bacterium]